MRLFAVYLIACLVAAGCAPPDNEGEATSSDSLSFPSGASLSSDMPTDGDTETITFTVQNNSPDGSAVNNIPYVINRDGTYFSGGTILTIAANETQTIVFSVTETDGSPHTYQVVLDPDDTTGAINTSTNTQSITVDWLPIGSG